jgi:hypothetical protein
MAKSKKPFDKFKIPGYKKLKCSKCINISVVAEDTASVICWECVTYKKY